MKGPAMLRKLDVHLALPLEKSQAKGWGLGGILLRCYASLEVRGAMWSKQNCLSNPSNPIPLLSVGQSVLQPQSELWDFHNGVFSM